MKNVNAKNNILNYGLIGLLSCSLFYFVSTVHSANIGGLEIAYPIAELGNCPDETACAAYCDKTENMEACVNFAQAKGLLGEREAGIAKKAIARIKLGETPGACNSRESCENFCQKNTASLNSCLAFAEELGISGEELDQAKKVAAALQGGAKLPGDCQGKAACESYCKNANHIDECLVFAEAAGILPAEELAEAKKVAPFLKSGQTPGACQTKEECRAYCSIDDNFNECLSFGEKVGFVSKEEAELARKTGGKGPGGCKSKQACQDYCNLQENAKTCADFALEKGLVSEAEADNIKNGAAKIKSGLEQTPAEIKGEVETCLNDLFGGRLQAVLAGEQMITGQQGGKIGACFEEAAKAYAKRKMQEGQSAGQSGGAPDAKALDSAPAEIRNQVNREIESRRQQAAEESMPQNIQIPTGPPANIPLSGAPAELPENIAPPAGFGPPAGVPENIVPPSAGYGPPAGAGQ